MQQSRTGYDFSRNQRLWHVDDVFIDQPGLKFQREHSPLIEATVENWGCYIFDNISDLPSGMVAFVTNFTKTLGLESGYLTNVKDVCESILHRIDYEEPYFFLVDTLVQLSHNELRHTYRNKRTGDVLNPARLETFKIDRGWTFEPYHVVKNIMTHPQMVAFLGSGVVPPQFANREEALKALFTKIASVVWGSPEWLDEMVNCALSSHIEGILYDPHKMHDQHIRNEAERALTRDKLFWLAGALGTITWLKGPQAVLFLTEYHVIYDRLLDIKDDGTVVPRSADDEVIIDGSSVYTLSDLDLLPNQKADKCSKCGAEAHCTKELNITALFHPVCSCGEGIDPTMADGDADRHWGQACQPYKDRYQLRTGFVCQRCIFVTVNNLGDHTKCGRTICPAVTCPHHMGNNARIAALTHQRTKQLTAPPRG